MTGYGVPTGSQIDYGAPGFPDWVYRLAQAFGLRASTYPGHQETDRAEAGFAPNPSHLNRGIDWAGTVDDMQRFATYLLSIRGSLEQVIFENPRTGQHVGVAGGRDVTESGYYASDYSGHRDHVHTRQSAPIPYPVVQQDDSVEAVMTANQEAFDRMNFEITNRWPSRSKYFRAWVEMHGGDPDAPIDTLVGFVLNIEGKVNDETVERTALLGNKDMIAVVKYLADKGDVDAKAVLAKVPKA